MHLDYTSHLFKQVSNLKSLSYTLPPYTISPEVTAFYFSNKFFHSSSQRGSPEACHPLVSERSFSSSTWKYQESTLPEQRQTALRCLGTQVSLNLPSEVCCCCCFHFKRSSVISHQAGNLHQLEAIFNKS